MATRPIVPRGDGEGSLGVNTAGSPKYWGDVFTNRLNGADAKAMAAYSEGILRKRNTIYAQGNKVVAGGLPVNFMLICTVGGTTADADITLPATFKSGDTFTDGTVTWQMWENVTTETFNNRQPLTIYALKDIRYSPLLPTGWFLECTTAGTTDSADITLPTPLVENATITDGTVTWKVRKISSADGMPIGAIIAFGGNGAIPSGYLLCDGAAYSRTALPDLFAAIGTDYGSGDGSTTFNVPDANQAKRFLQGDTVAGTVKAAGLPNITGRAQLGTGFTAVGVISSSGSFFDEGSYSAGQSSADTTANASYLTFDASLSNPIYGNSTTVQPPALTARYIIKAFDGQTADSALIDITQYENELAGKADRSLSNLTDAGKSFSFPSGTYLDISSYINSTYTAPADGFVVLRGSGVASSSSLVRLSNEATSLVNSGYSTVGWGIGCSIPCKKGDTILLTVSNVSNTVARFIYTAGEVPTP